MGCNVLQPDGPGYLVGSFSGLFVWDIRQQTVLDAFTGHVPREAGGRPVSDHLISGYATAEPGEHSLFDYNRGMLNTEIHWKMPEAMRKETPISLWSTALEIHTGRIFEHLLGPFYLLYVPLSGICLLMVLISGFLIWRKTYRRHK